MMITNSKIALPPRFWRAGSSLACLASSEDGFWFMPGLIWGFVSVAGSDAPDGAFGPLPVALADAVAAFALEAASDFCSAASLATLALPLLSIEMVSDGLAFGSAGFAEASGFGVSGFFTVGPLQFAVVPGHYLDAEKSGKCGV